MQPELHERILAAPDLEAAMSLLRRHLRDDPEDADARHWLGSLLLEAGQFRAAGAEWRRVRRLDMVSDRAHGHASTRARRRVEAAARRALAALPSPFAELIADVPVVVEERPSSELVAEGFDPRAYGLFEGPSHEDRGMTDAPPAPSRIVVFHANLAADFEDEAALEAQVGITVAHEVGHFFGLDEDDMLRLGLD